MTLTSAQISPFYISIYEWNTALDLASRKQDGVSLYGWNRSSTEAVGGGKSNATPASESRDGFGFAWGQSMKSEDVQALAAALRRVLESTDDAVQDFLPQLIAFLEKCAMRNQGIKLEQ